MEKKLGGKEFETETVVIDPKRRRIEDLENTDMGRQEHSDGPQLNIGKKLARDRSCCTGPSRPMILIAWNCCGLVQL